MIGLSEANYVGVVWPGT